jgi:Protein kinase domain
MECLEEPLPALAATLRGWADEGDVLQDHDLDEDAAATSRYTRCYEELQVLACNAQHRLTSCCNRESGQPHLAKATSVCVPAKDVLQHVDLLRDLLTREGRLMARINHFAHMLPLQGAWLEQRYVAATDQQQESSSNAGDWVEWSHSSSGWSHAVQGCSDGDSPLPLCVPWDTSLQIDSRSNRSSSDSSSSDNEASPRASPLDAVAEPKWPLHSSTVSAASATSAADGSTQSSLVIQLTAYLLFPDCVPLSVWLQQQNGLASDDSELTHKQVLNIVLCVAQALADLHAQGLVHNAVHPGSVFIAADDSSVVYLGGLQNCATAGSRSTNSSSAADCDQYECYSSPETRCRRAVDSHSDTYALGVLYFELLLRLRYSSSSSGSDHSSATECDSMIAATVRSASYDSTSDAETAAVVTAALVQSSGSSSNSSSCSSSDSAAFSADSIELLLRLLARDSYVRCDAFEVVDELKEQLQTLV